MRYRRLLLVMVILAIVPVAVFGTSSFSAVSADRGVSAEVVDDQSAYLKITQVDNAEGFVNGEPFTVLHLADQFPDSVALDSVTVGSSLVTVSTSTATNIPTPPDSLDVQVQCGESGNETVPVTVVAEGASNRAVVERAVSVTCLEPEIQSVEFTGCGNALVEADDAIYPLSVTKVIDNPGGDGTTTSTVTLDSDGKVDSAQGGKLVALEADGNRYENPNHCTNRSGVPESPPSDDTTTTEGENGSG